MATTTNYGWDTPDDTDLVKDGALAIRDLGQDVDTQLFTALGGDYPGLRLIKTQTIGTAVSSVNVTGAFSSTYENYKIIVSGGSASAENVIKMTIGGSNTAYYGAAQRITYSTGATTISNVNNGVSWDFVGNANPQGNTVTCELLGPNLAKYTTYVADYSANGSSGTSIGKHLSTTAYTSFTLIPAAGTLTGGTIYVYGYGAS
jgi:hypothetical protein